MDDSSNKFIYTSHQVTKYPSSHLMTVGWYLDCFGGFVPTLEEALHRTLIQTTPVEIRVVYCVVTDPALSQRHDKIGMMTARHRVGPSRYHDGGGKWDNFTVT